MYSNEITKDTLPLKYGDNPVIRYTKNHEWIASHKDSNAFIGITKYAADALGDTTFVEVNEVPVDVEAGESIGSVESVKSASDVYSPVTGKLIASNEALIENPALLNEDPMGESWLAKIEITNPEELESLMDHKQYESFLEDSH